MGDKEILEIQIVQAHSEDAAGAAQVFYQTWLETYPNEEFGITREDVEARFAPRLSQEGIAKMAEQISQPKPDTLFLVAKNGDNIVGVCRARKDGAQNELGAIYVLPEYQGQGIGYKFWQEIKKFFDPDKDIIVKVATYNKGAISFYQKLGFVDTGKRFAEEAHRFKSGAIIPEMEMIIKK